MVRIVVVAALLAVVPARAGESDPFWEWRRPVRDSGAELDRRINDAFARGLAAVNASPRAADLACVDVARRMKRPMAGFEFLFFAGRMRGYSVDASPRSNSEEAARKPVGLYRFVPFWNVGLTAPLRPVVRAGDVRFGLDKIGHFFAEGVDGYRIVLARRAAGDDERAAIEAAIRYGVRQESSIYGKDVTGVFSYADLDANARGVKWLMYLCDAPDPALRFVDGAWRLREPFVLGRWTTPCWDEAWRPNAYFGDLAADVFRGLRASCALRGAPHVRARFARYADMRCDEDVDRVVAALAARGDVPDPRDFTLAAVCR